MKKILATLLLSAVPLFGDYYYTAGIGPVQMVPNFGVGFRETNGDTIGDIAFTYSIGNDYGIANLSLSGYYKFPSTDIYFGPSLGCNIFMVKNCRTWADQCFGCVIGTQRDRYFMEMSIQKEISKPRYRITMPMIRLKSGFLF